MSELAILGGEPLRKTPFHGWPIYGQEEERALLDVLQKSKWGIGKRTGVINEFEEQFASYHNAKSAVACTNCTQALEIILSVLGIGIGDEVIVPSYTFIATASAVTRVGATPVFADIDKNTFLIDSLSIESLISPKTKAIICVLFSGHFPDMHKIKEIAEDNDLFIIEDAAQAHGARWDGYSPGCFGPAAFSFQYSKNMTAGEGGIIISQDSSFIERCWEHIWHGRKKGGLWYEHFETTSNFRITEWSAAVLLAQLKRLTEQNNLRMNNAQYLTELLKKNGLVFPAQIDPRTEVHPRHLFLMRINTDAFRDIPKDNIAKALNAEGIPVVPGYKFPLYKNPAFQNANYGLKNLEKKTYKDTRSPNAELVCSDSLWLIHNILLGSKEDMEYIANGFLKLQKNIEDLRCL